MKNRWLKKDSSKIELGACEPPLGACENEISDCEPAIGANNLGQVSAFGYKTIVNATSPTTCSTFAFGYKTLAQSVPEMKLPDIKFGDAPVMTSTCTGDFSNSPFHISKSFVSPFSTGLEVNMDLGDGNIKYIREIKVGPFTFKDAGNLGLDIFLEGKRLGWINSLAEADLSKWLSEKDTIGVVTKSPTAKASGGVILEDTVINDKPWVPGKKLEDGFVKWSANESKAYAKTIEYVNHGYKSISNESINSSNSFDLEYKNVVPGSVLFTVYIDSKYVHSEIVAAQGKLADNYYSVDDRPNKIVSAQMDHNSGHMDVVWNVPPKGNVVLSFCYEYYIGKSA